MKRYWIILAATIAAIGVANAQEGGYNESVVVRGSYRPTIDQAEKLNFPAVITDTIGRMEHAFQYNISPVRLKALYEPSRIKAARIVGEPATKLYNNYLRLGFGNYWTPLADLYWSSTRDRKKTYGVRINHLSSWGTLPEYGPNHFGQTGVTLFGKYIVGETLQLSSDIGYEHDHNLYYGGWPDSTMRQMLNKDRSAFSTKDYRASYNVASWNFGLHNMELDPNKLGYGADVHVSDLWTIYGNNEFNLRVDGDVHYGFTLANRYKGVAYLRLGWDYYDQRLQSDGRLPQGYVDLGNADSVREQLNVLKVNPYVDFLLSGLQFHVGLTTGMHSWMDIDSSASFYIMPDVVVSKKLLDEKLALSLGATGGVDAVSLNSIRLVNPYVAPDAKSATTPHYDFSFQARWTLSKKLEANAEAVYSIRTNELDFFPLPYNTISSGSLPYDNDLQLYWTNYIDLNQLTLGGDIAFVNDEMLTLRAGGHYYNYSLRNEEGTQPTEVHYRPSWDALLSADVNYKDRWLFHLEGRLIGSMLGYRDALPMRYGIAAEVEYRHNRALSFFLRADNLAFQRYMLWDLYPSQRGLFILGLTYTIPHK